MHNSAISFCRKLHHLNKYEMGYWDNPQFVDEISLLF